MSPVKGTKTAPESSTGDSTAVTPEASKMEQGAVCKEVRSPMTIEQLRALRHEVEQGKISKKAAEYNHPESKLEKSDSLASILEKIFTQKGVKAPKGGIERIELALTANGLDLQKLNADSWKVESGKLVFIGKKGKTPVDIFTINLLPWASLEAKEKDETLLEHHYDLGVYRGAPVMPSTPDTIEGGVDATPHGVNLRQAKWYEEKVHSAALMLKLYDNNKNRFDSATQTLIAGHEKMLRDLASQTDYTPLKMRADFEKKYAKAEVSGGDGVYNFVLAFQRVLDAYGKEDKRLTNPDAKTVVSLVVGKTLRKKDERYVKAVIKSSEDQPDTPPTICGPDDEPKPPPPTPPEDDKYRDRSSKDKEHLMVTTDEGKLLPSSAQFKENIDVDVASTALLDSYAKTGTKALVEGLKAIPEAQRQAVLDSIFKKLGEKDPQKAFDLMKDIVKEEKGAQENAVYEGLKENMDKAPDQNQKDFWKIQMLLFETSQAGDIDSATGKVRVTAEQTQAKMREVVDLVSKVDGAKLPAELQEMFKQQKQYFETSMRQGIAADYVETAIMTVESMMKNKTDKDTYVETSFESLKKMSRAEIKDELTQWYGMDNDSEVYMSSMHVLEALRLAVTYQYPQDVAAGKKIENPIEHYFNEIKNGTLTEIKLNDGATAEMKDVLLDKTVACTGKIDLSTLFVDKAKEFDLFDQYQKGSEQLGEDSFWNSVQEYKEGVFGNNKTAAKVASYASLLFPVLGGVSAVSALSQVASDERLSFMEKNGGLVEGSKMFFPKDGDLAAFMKDVPAGGTEEYANLGATEKLQMYKILQLISMKHYDEARSLCIQALQKKLEAKKKISDNEIKDKSLELYKDYGEKIAAQVRIQLEGQKINNAFLQTNQVPRPGGGVYTDIIDLINDRVKGAIDEMAYIRLQDDVSNSLTDADVGGFSLFEKSAYEKLQFMNGHKLDTAWMTIEHANVVKDVAVMVAEIIIIELVTLGFGTYFAGAAGVVEGTAIAARAGGTVVRVGEIGTNVSRGSRVVQAINTAGRTGALAGRLKSGATGIGGGVGKGIRYIAEGKTIPARMLGQYIHGASFVELQSLMHGRPVNPASLDGQVQIATVAATMYGLGKLQQFTRGQLGGARAIREGGTLTGWRALPGVRNINQLSARLGNTAQALDRGTSVASRVGSKAFTAGEIGLEITALQGLGELEQEMAVLTGTMTEDQRKAMKDPDAFNRWAHTAGVVLGLRTWRVVKQGPKPPEPPPGDPGLPKELPRGMEVEKLRSYIKDAIVKKEGKEPLSPETRADFIYQLTKAEEYLSLKGQDPAYANEIIRQALNMPEGKIPDKASIIEARDRLMTELPGAKEDIALRKQVLKFAGAAEKAIGPTYEMLMVDVKNALKSQNQKKIADSMLRMVERMNQNAINPTEAMEYMRTVFGISSETKITAENWYELTRNQVINSETGPGQSRKEAVLFEATEKLVDASTKVLFPDLGVKGISIPIKNPEAKPAERIKVVNNIRELTARLEGFDSAKATTEQTSGTVKGIMDVVQRVDMKKYSNAELQQVLKTIFKIDATETVTTGNIAKLTETTMNRFHQTQNAGKEAVSGPIFRALAKLVDVSITALK